MDHTLQDNMVYVQEYMKAEGADPSRSMVLILFNQALRIISSRTEVYEKVWSNAADGGLTLTTNSAPIPTDCIRINSIEWDGSSNRLDKYTKDQLDKARPGWRDEVGDPVDYTLSPTAIILGSAPSGTTTGKLVARGVAYLPDFSDAPGATNPLLSLPVEHQLLPAAYVLAMLPIVTVNRAPDEIRLQIERRNTHAGIWDDGLKALTNIAEARKFNGVVR